MKVQLNEKASKIYNQIRTEFKERKLKNPDWDDVISELFCQLDRKNWLEQIEKRTPDSFYIEQALSDKKLQKDILKFVRNQMGEQVQVSQ